jgi:hypothetical protein
MGNMQDLVNLNNMANFLSDGRGGIDPVKLQQWNNFVYNQQVKNRSAKRY